MYVCFTFLIRNGPNLQEKGQNMHFHDFLSPRQYSQNSNEKNKPSFLIVMILQCTKNLPLNFFIQYNDIGNFKILQLFL